MSDEPTTTAQDPGAEQRVHVRYTVYLDAKLIAADGSRTPCKIRDYCRGGLFLAWDAGSAHPAVARGARVGIVFATEGGPHATEFRLDALVARALAGGIGVAFTFADAQALAALDALARGLPARAPAPAGARPGAEARQRIVASCRELVGSYLQPLVEAFLTRCDERLFTCARSAENDAMQRQLLDTMTLLQQRRVALAEAITVAAAAQFERLGEQREDTGLLLDPTSKGLSLIDKDEFEELLIIAEIVSQAEPSYKDELSRIERRLCLLADAEVDRSNNPVGPASLCRVVSEALRPLGLAAEHLRIIYEVMEDALIARLGTLYEQLDGLLEKNGVMPVEPATTPKPQPAPAVDAEADTFPAQVSAPPAPVSAARTGAPPAAGSPPGIASGAVPAAPGVQPAQPPAAAPAPGMAPAAYDAVRALLELQRQLARPAAAPAAPGAMPGAAPAAAVHGAAAPATAPAPAPAPLFDTRELLEAITSLEQEARGPWAAETEGEDFRSRLQAVLASRAGGEAKQIGARESDALAMIGEMLQSLSEDQLIPEALRPQLRRLRMPLHKLAIADPSFLSNAAHPARMAINRLAQLELDATADGTDGDLRSRLDAEVEKMATGYGSNPAVFEQALADLDRIAAERNADYRQNLRGVVNESEAQQALLRAKRRASPEGGERAAPKEVSKEWAVWLNRAKRLRVGDVLALKRGNQQPQRIALAWVGEDYHQFVFANAKGRRAATMTLQELAMQLRRGSAQVLDRSDLPAVDRAVYSTLYKMHDRIGRQALEDPLTGFVNRKKFLVLLERTLLACAREDVEHTLLLLRFAGIDAITARASPAAGDSLLKKVAGILSGRMGESTRCARVAEYEFALLLNGVAVADAGDIARELITLVGKIRVRFREEKFALSANIGLAAVNQSAGDPQALLAAAAAACDEAAAAGPNGYAVARAEAAAAEGGEQIDWPAWITAVLAEERVTLRCARIRALAGPDTPEPYCEIVLAAETGDGVVVMPNAVAQSGDLIEQMQALDRLVIRESLKWMARNRELLDRLGGCAINLSPHSLADPGLMDFVLGQLTDTMVPPGRVCFELTEAGALANLDEAERFIRTMKEFGCRFALDDFGSGDTAQGYLNNLPVDYLKIDGMFTRDLTTNPNDVAVVKSIREISNLMGKKTIADDVDTDDVVERLREIGVTYVEGGAVGRVCLMDEVV